LRSYTQGICHGHGAEESRETGKERSELVRTAEPWLAKQVALAIVDAEIEQLNQLAFILDLFNDQIKAITIEPFLDISTGDFQAHIVRIGQEETGISLHETEILSRQSRQIEFEMSDLVKGEAEAKISEPRQVPNRDLGRRFDIGPGKFKEQLRCKIRVLCNKIDEITDKLVSARLSREMLQKKAVS